MAQFTPRKSGAGRVFGSSPIRMPLRKGCFMDGVWHCNCSPRLPASRFQVKKEGPNKGRWFYTCQEPKDKACGFFLWDDGAKGRETGAVLGNSRSELGASVTPNKKRESPLEVRRTTQGQGVASDTNLDKESDDDYGDWPLTAADEVRAVETAERSVSSMEPPETPRKALKTTPFATPSSKRKRSEEYPWPTPASTTRSRDDDVFKTPTTTRSTPAGFNNSIKPGLISPSASPTPNRRLDFGAATAPSATGSADYDITEEVMELLKDQSIDAETTTSLRKLLNRYALKTSGIEKGRDITRVALKAKESKIAELQQRIQSLETEREMDKLVIRHFKNDMSESVSRRARGRGRGRGS